MHDAWLKNKLGSAHTCSRRVQKRRNLYTCRAWRSECAHAVRLQEHFRVAQPGAYALRINPHEHQRAKNTLRKCCCFFEGFFLFSLSRRQFRSFFSLWGSFSWNCGRGSRPWPSQSARFGFSGVLLCEPRPLLSRRRKQNKTKCTCDTRQRERNTSPFLAAQITLPA